MSEDFFPLKINWVAPWDSLENLQFITSIIDHNYNVLVKQVSTLTVIWTKEFGFFRTVMSIENVHNLKIILSCYDGEKKMCFLYIPGKKNNYELPEHFLSNNIIKCTKISILMPVGFLVKYVALQSKQHLTAIEVYLVDQATKLFWKTELSRVEVFLCACATLGEKNFYHCIL